MDIIVLIRKLHHFYSLLVQAQYLQYLFTGYLCNYNIYFLIRNSNLKCN